MDFRPPNRNEAYFTFKHLRCINELCCLLVTGVSRDKRFPTTVVNGFLHRFTFFLLEKGRKIHS